MNDGARRAVAFIAARLCSSSRAEAIFDPAAGRHFSYDGEVEPTVGLYDRERRCHIGGGPRILYDGGTHAFVNLVISGDSFTGYDHACSHHFGGRTKGSEVWMVDCEADRRFTFTLVGSEGPHRSVRSPHDDAAAMRS